MSQTVVKRHAPTAAKSPEALHSHSFKEESSALKDKVVLVTGAGRGLGEATCRVLSAAGAAVIATDFRAETLESTVPAVGRDGKCRVAMLDVCNDRQAADVMVKVLHDFGRIDALVNNAAVDVTVPIDELPVDDWDRILRTNLRGPFLLARNAFSIMKKQGGGQIVNICSTASKRAWANASAYHATKWGLLGLSHALHSEGRAHNIKVTAVICGGMRTPFLLERFPDIDVGVLQDPKNVADAIRFVLSQPAETVIAEITVLPTRETSWP